MDWELEAVKARLKVRRLQRKVEWLESLIPSFQKSANLGLWWGSDAEKENSALKKKNEWSAKQSEVIRNLRAELNQLKAELMDKDWLWRDAVALLQEKDAEIAKLNGWLDELMEYGKPRLYWQQGWDELVARIQKERA